MTYTNKGAWRERSIVYQGATPPTNFFVMLFTSAVTPTQATDLVSDLTEIAAGNGYTSGGISLSRNATDFDVNTENDGVINKAITQIKDVVWTASGGNLPISGGGALWVGLVNDTATIADREVWQFWSLGSARTVSSGQLLTAVDLRFDAATA